jgi:GMP synthase (glutamine-hydrolysing)
VLVVDFGAQYAQLIARRVREARVYSEVIPHTATVEEIKAKDPQAIVLSGGPASVYTEGAPQLDPALFDLGVPVFGICYGFQAMAQALGGTVAHTGTSEYGRTELNVVGGQLHSDLPNTQPVWMSHGDAVTAAPEGFEVVASSSGAPVAGFEDRGRRLAGVQYHPEVMHTPHGQQVLSRFLHEFAGIDSRWTPANIADALVEQVRTQIGDGRAICGLSGGVDSAVAAALVQRAIGDRLTCVFVDHGLLRSGERAQVQRDFVAATGANLVTVDVADRFLAALAGVTNPEGKRKIIGRQFIRAFEGAVRDIVGESGSEVEFLVQGTLYPDVVESGGGSGTANIKSHHNVGGLPDDRSSSSSSRFGCCSKTRCAPSGANWVYPRKSLRANPFRARVWASASSVRSPRRDWTLCGAQTRSPVKN